MSDHIKETENTESSVMTRPFNGLTMASLKEKALAAATPFNIVAAVILAIGIPIAWIRFTEGIGAVSNLTDTYPWGLWIGFDVLCGVALAAGGYVTASTVYLFGLKEYRPVVRPAVLTGFLGYFFVVVGLLFDLGRPWRLPFPMFVSFGTTSVMFLVAWHVALYLSVQFLEFSPAVFEWLGWKRVRRFVASLTIGAPPSSASSSPPCTSRLWAPSFSWLPARFILYGILLIFRCSSLSPVSPPGFPW